MIDKQIVSRITSDVIDSQNLFLVDITVTPANDIEVVVDSDTRVSIDQCADLSRKIEAQMDREAEDFSLTVCSAGIGYPFKVERQFAKCVGKDITVIFKEGKKLTAILEAAESDTITLKYYVMEVPQGEKKKKKIEKIETINKTQIKSVCEALTIK